MPGLVPGINAAVRFGAAWMAGRARSWRAGTRHEPVLLSSRSAPRALFVARALHPPPPSCPALCRASTPECASAPRGWPGQARPW